LFILALPLHVLDHFITLLVHLVRPDLSRTTRITRGPGGWAAFSRSRSFRDFRMIVAVCLIGSSPHLP
jgi:hypothetical protein